MTVLDFKSIKDIPFGEHRFFYGSFYDECSDNMYWKLYRALEQKFVFGVRDTDLKKDGFGMYEAIDNVFGSEYHKIPINEGIVCGIDTEKTSSICFLMDVEHTSLRDDCVFADNIYESIQEWKEDYEQNLQNCLNNFMQYLETKCKSFLESPEYAEMNPQWRAQMMNALQEAIQERLQAVENIFKQ